MNNIVDWGNNENVYDDYCVNDLNYLKCLVNEQEFSDKIIPNNTEANSISFTNLKTDYEDNLCREKIIKENSLNEH